MNWELIGAVASIVGTLVGLGLPALAKLSTIVESLAALRQHVLSLDAQVVADRSDNRADHVALRDRIENHEGRLVILERDAEGPRILPIS